MDAASGLEARPTAPLQLIPGSHVGGGPRHALTDRSNQAMA